MKHVFMEKKLPFGWTLCQYWPSEVILKHPSRKHGIYIKAPWYKWADNKRYEAKDGSFVSEDIASPKDDRGFRLNTIREWSGAREYRRDFSYTTRHGALQRSSLVARRKRTRSVRWWLRWLPFAGHDYDELMIEFSDEMGSERGSWKGGCIGTSVSMKKDETVHEALDRFLAHAQVTFRWDR